MNRKANQSSNAFTLIELLVVIAIIGLLSSIVLASLSGARKSAQVTRMVSDLQQIETSLVMWMQGEGYTQWPHPTNDLNMSGDGVDGYRAEIGALASQTSFGDYINSSPDAPFGKGKYLGDKKYLYWRHGGSFSCGDYSYYGVNIRVEYVPTDVMQEVNDIVDGENEQNVDCGKVRTNSHLHYSLSNNLRF